jgi:hypothetical protein
MIPAIKYGITTRYKIPLFSPAPIEVSPLLTLFSTDALHMAHCAEAPRETRKLMAKRTAILNFMGTSVFGSLTTAIRMSGYSMAKSSGKQSHPSRIHTTKWGKHILPPYGVSLVDWYTHSNTQTGLETAQSLQKECG